MQKLWIIGGVIVLLFAAIIGLTMYSNSTKLKDNPYDTNDLNQATIDLLDDENYQEIILPEDLKKQIASGEPTLAYMFSPLCTHCQNFTPKLMEVVNELDVDIVQLNVLEYDEAWATYGITATPTLIYFNEGKEVTRLVGDYDKEQTRAFLKGSVLK
jgi:thioredoxin 1